MICSVCKSCRVCNLEILDRCKWCGSQSVEHKDVELSEFEQKLISTGKYKLKEK